MAHQVYDGFENLEGGMNGGFHPSLVPGNQAFKAINVTFRDGKVRTRPRFQEYTLVGSDAVLDIIRNRKYQGWLPYKDDTGAEYVAFAIGGHLFLLEPSTDTITHLTTGGGATPLDETADRIYMVQADKWLIAQDGGTATIAIVDGTASRDAVTGAGGTEESMPFGTIMAYCHGRLFIKTGPRTFLAGDIVLPNDRENVKKFTENLYLDNGGSFLLPAEHGEITAMFAAHRYGTGTGQGPLVVLGERGGMSYNVWRHRQQVAGEGVPGWVGEDLANEEPPGNGCTSHDSIVKLNEDILHMSWRGLQSMSLVKHDTASTFRVTNFSEELKPFWKQEDPTKLQYVSAAKFNDRVIFTMVYEACSAQNAAGDTIDDHCFKGLGVVDFATFNGVSTLGRNVRPAFDGLWTGIRPLGIASSVFGNEERCFVWAKDANNQNRIFEILDELGDDNSIAGGNSSIECSVETRALPFTSFLADAPTEVPYLHKHIAESFVWVSEVLADLNIRLLVKPDYAVNYELLSTIVKDVPTGQSPLAISNMPFPAVDRRVCDSVTGRTLIRGYRYQMRLEWNGVSQFDRFAVMAHADREREVIPCGQEGVATPASTVDDFTYSV